MTESISVLFATPTRGELAAEYSAAMRATIMLLVQNHVNFGFADLVGGQHLRVARDQMAAAFLDCPEVESLFFIDDDLGWPPDKVLEILRRPEPIVGGVYRLKQDVVEYPCSVIRDGDQIAFVGDLIKVRSMPCGFCRIRRCVFETMAKTARKYFDVTPNNRLGLPLWDFFSEGLDENNEFVEGDVAFMRRAQDLGFDVLVDPNIEFTHRGSYAFRGKFADVLGKGK